MTTETKAKPKEKKEKKASTWSPAAQTAAQHVMVLWQSVVSVQGIRGATKGEKVHESLERASTYLQRAAKQIGEEVAA
jgi:hypothetical protein